KLQREAKTQEEQMFYIFHLRNTKQGWTPELRQQYFAWLDRADNEYTGGASFKPFLKNIRSDAMKTLTPQEKLALAPTTKPAIASVAAPVPAKKFVRNWKMIDLTPALDRTKS